MPRAARTPRSTVTAVAILAVAALVTGASPAGAREVPRPPVAGAERIPGGWAVPAIGKAPAWYTKAYHRRVLAAGTKGVRLPAGVTVPAAVGLVANGIRPGQWLISVGGLGFSWCTANFVFRSSGGAYGLGTAGHCAAKDALGGFPDVTAYVRPPPGKGRPGIYHIGRFVLSRNKGIGNDFAMVSIYTKYKSWVAAAAPVFGGPRGVFKGRTTQIVAHYGHGAGVGAGGTPRAGMMPNWATVLYGGGGFAWYGVGMEGDSGGFVQTGGDLAVGNLTHKVILDNQSRPGMLAGTRMVRIQQIASGWTLVRAG
jgi:hypothetical protein